MLMLITVIFALSVASLEIRQTTSEIRKDDEMHYFISARQRLPHVRLVQDLLANEKYDSSVRPVRNYSDSLTVRISMSLYQVIDVDESSQYLTLYIWMIQEWVDEFLDWNPSEYDMINYTVLPHNVLWIPDTFIYNSVVMSHDESERHMNAIIKSRRWKDKYGAEVYFLYPAIYTVRCHIDIRYFPYDHQSEMRAKSAKTIDAAAGYGFEKKENLNCTLTLGSWTSSMALLNYTTDKTVNMHSYILNEEWDILSFNLYRHEYLYACCQNPWAIIEGSLIIRRRPLYYIVNLIIPTTILTLVAIVGFFTPSSTNDERSEKITIGITTLLAISILMLMVSDQMPTTSDFVPHIAWFYLSNIIIISVATFCTSFVHYIHVQHRNGKLPPALIRILFFKYICNYLYVSAPQELIMLRNSIKSNDTEPSRKLSMRRISKDCTDKETEQETTKLSAKKKWARISVNLNKVPPKSSLVEFDLEIKPTENLQPKIVRKRKVSTINSNRKSLWNTAVQFVRFTNDDLPQKVESTELKFLKYRRQCTLEWEFLATVIDRAFLLLFSTITLLTVIILAVTAKLAQYHFDKALGIDQN